MRPLRIAAICLLPTALFAQRSTALPGALVRVSTADGPPIQGIVTAVSRDTIVVARSAQLRSSIPTTSVRRIEQFAGHSHAAGAARGAFIAGIAGAVIGVAAPAKTGRGASMLTGLYLGGTLGEWVGSIKGRDVWHRVDVRAPSSSAPLTARTPIPPVLPGWRVRVSAPGVVTDSLEGTVTESTGDSLALFARGIRISIPASAITKVERPTFSRGAGAASGAGWGAVTVAPLSPLLLFDGPANAGAGSALLAGMTMGAVIGAFLGASSGKEGWEPVRP